MQLDAAGSFQLKAPFLVSGGSNSGLYRTMGIEDSCVGWSRKEVGVLYGVAVLI
jgi:hypothetical protein